MDKRLKMLQDLIPLIDRYYVEFPEGEINHFLLYHGKISEVFREKKSESAVSHMDQYSLKTKISFHLGRLGKYVKYYLRHVFKDSELTSSDDFAYLATLERVGEMNKSNLIQYNVGELSGGMESIRRLVNRGLAEEVVNPHDRRERLLRITQKGSVELAKLYRDMSVVAQLITGKLSEEEQTQFAYLLTKLDLFHESVYREEKNSGLDEIASKYL